MPGLVVILNRSAGAASRARGLERELAARGDGSALVVTRSAEEGRRAAGRAAREGAAAVLAAGGDGTVQSVAQGLLDAGEKAPPLGILPLGRGNDLAGSLGVPRRWRAALAAADPSRTVPLDVGRARLGGRETLFVNALGIGFDADVARRARRVRLPGAGAYVVGVLGALIAHPGPWRLAGEVDGTPVERAVTLLSLGNGATTGGGFRMTPDADPTDGWLDACWADAGPRRQVLALLPRVALGRHGGDRRITLARCRRLVLAVSPPAPVHADGEVLPPAERLEVEILPGALRALAPSGALT